MRSAGKLACVAVGAALAGGAAAVAQSVPVVGLPSQPFAPAAQAQNGGAGPQVTYQYGMEFVTVRGSPQGVDSSYPHFSVNGTAGEPRGGLNYDFRIGRYEVGAASWSAFFDAIHAVEAQAGQPIPFISQPGNLNGGGQYGRTGNISWRTAAIYCNWLHNDQALTRAAFMNGAYDVSTFGLSGNLITDQHTHNPGARFWIPTLDEWIRAAHFDPNHNSPTYGAWWQFSIRRDTYANPGLPGQPAPFPFGGFGEANAGFSTPNLYEFGVPLGAYGNVQSPWGLFDTIGQTTEWLEEPLYQAGPDLPYSRLQAGAYLTGSASDVVFGSMQNGAAIGAAVPLDAAYWMGFRLAAAVPSPGAGSLLLTVGGAVLRRRRRDATG